MPKVFPIHIYAVLFCILFFSTFQFPYQTVAQEHDSASQASLEYWTLHKFQYGTEIVQNVGPLGFIDYPALFTGFLDKEKLVLNILVTALFCVLIILISKRIASKTTRWIFWIWVILFSVTWLEFPGYLNADVKLDLTLLLIAYTMLETENIFVVAFLAAVLGFLSLGKGTLLFMSLLVLGVAAINYLVRKKPLLVAAEALMYGVSVIFCWESCGQQLRNFPSFVGNMLGVSNGYASGYTDSMFIYEKPYMTALGICAAMIALGAIATKNFYHITRSSLPSLVSSLSYALFEFFILYTVWKHGFVRADGHMIIFFYFVIIAGTLFFCVTPSNLFHLSLIRRLFMYALYGICLAGIIQSTRELNYISRYRYCPQILKNFSILKDETDYIADLLHEFSLTVSEFQLPHAREVIGAQKVSYFGFISTPVLYNDFNYKPMPNTVSFTGWNHASMENDAAFFREDSLAPYFLFYSQATIDNRMSAQDDSLAQLEILQHYEPVIDNNLLAENHFSVLLKRKQGASLLIREAIGEERQFALGSWIDAPDSTSYPVWVRIKMPQTLLSVLLKQLYKPPEYAFEYTLSDGTVHTRKFMATMAEEGFLIAPFIDNTLQFISVFMETEYKDYLIDKNPRLQRIVKFRITCKHLQWACSDSLNVDFEAVHGLKLGQLHHKVKTGL